MQKMHFITLIFFWYITLKTSCSLIGLKHFCLKLKNQIFPIHSFVRMTKAFMVHNVKPKKYTSMEKILCTLKKKKNYGYSLAFSKNEIFSEKNNNNCVTFLHLRHHKFKWYIINILWAVFMKKWFLTDWLTDWQWWFHRTLSSLKAGVL